MSNLTPQPNIPPTLKARLQASYDAIAPVYNAWTEPHNTLRLHYLSKLLQLIPSNPPPPETEPEPRSTPSTVTPLRALELGCGAGVPATATLLNHGLHVTANDLSPAQLQLGRANFPAETDAGRVVWLPGDMMALEFPRESFDAVVALFSVVHLPREEQAVLMERVAGWLQPGGVVLVNFAKQEIEGVVDERWLGEEKGWMYWSGWGEEKTLEVVRERAGLEVLVAEVRAEEGDAEFLWVIARRPGSGTKVEGDR